VPSSLPAETELVRLPLASQNPGGVFPSRFLSRGLLFLDRRNPALNRPLRWN